MAKIAIFSLLFYLVNLILLLNNTLVNSNSFAIRLIHPDSQESPYFQMNNLSKEGQIKRLVSQTNIRGEYLESRKRSSTMRVHMNVQSFNYVVKIGIGTFKSKPPYMEYYLDMDTGSSQVWIQCAGCKICFKQKPKPFPKENSSSFRPVLDGNTPRPYETKYADGDITRGILARETFYLTAKNGGLARIENLQFGCGLENGMLFGRNRNNKIAGMMGLGWKDHSFVRQISPLTNGKFSYCLPVLSAKSSNSYLTFGDDRITTHQKNSGVTPLYRYKKHSPYRLELQGISLNNTKLNIEPKVFGSIGSSCGCIIDSGTPYSRIIAPAFDKLKQEMEKYFSRFKEFKKIKGDLDLDLCYARSKPGGFSKLPHVTFLFQGSKADFVVKPEAVFEVARRFRCSFRFCEYFCLAMIRSTTETIIGTHQQTNQRIIYDTKNQKLFFYPEDCSKNP